jgi:sulfatase modifying factor 1
LTAVLALACSRAEPERDPQRSTPEPSSATSTPASVDTPPLALLYLPDAGEAPPPIAGGLLPGAPRGSSGRCPAEMVDVRGQFCVDRYEMSLVDRTTELPVSPHYHPTRAQTRASWERYRGEALKAGVNVPPPPSFQLERDPALLARSLPGVLPQGYLNRDLAEAACRAAGKRLCTHDEWVLACRGEKNRKYPYGEVYSEGACNVFREAHPAAVLHGNPSREHLDPRLGLVTSERGPLLRTSGATTSCRSEWAGDGVFDMVGNIDEWVEDGGFLGGFFSRATREGCDARVASHPAFYFDYSTGGRCCRNQ